MRRRKITTVLAFCMLLALLIPSVGADEKSSSKEALAGRIDSIIKRAGKGKWAVEVVSLDSGEVFYRRNHDLPMIPASNVKLFTTGAALHYLGPEFKVKTSVYFAGELGKDGILQGDLIIYGRGDPNISGRFTDDPTTIFKQMAESLKAQGLREVRGNVIGDDSYFDAEYYGPWLPEESHKWYAARVSALSLNDNCIDIYVTPGTIGGRPRVVKSPRTDYMRIRNRASTTTKRNNSVWASPLENSSTILVGGRIWSEKKEEILWFPVESPPLYAATVFKETLEGAGIRVSGKARALGPDHKSAVPAGAKPVIEHESLPLSEIIKVVNKRSQNLHAELLLKQMGLHEGPGPTFAGGVKVVNEFLKMSGIASEAVVMHDGSGLCRSNRASAHSMVQILKLMDAGEWRALFRDSLAVAGVDNSLRSMRWSVPEGRLAAKTGSLKKVLSLSGYADGKHERLAFSIIINDFKGGSQRIRDARDRICGELVKY
jgi:D-alanyl-D-alanine carboxypeptidase/D-alanyl-D-alanine-endopeptidase (penicillin-binding protein 4)